MPLRVGILTAAHMHVHAYVHAFSHHPETELIGIWDDDIERGESFAQQTGIPFVGYLDDLLNAVDAVTITCENVRHAELVTLAARAGKQMLCEKPLGTSEAELNQIEEALSSGGVKLMTAFPCRFSPAYQRLKSRVKFGEIGKILAVAATNRGRCPFGWFVEPEKSGGGALIDHVVHVTDLLRDLLGQEPLSVQAQIGRNLYSQPWEDTAMLTLEFPENVFATIDSSWSRPQNFKTWGDVTLTVVGESGVIELDMFGQGLDVYRLDSGFSSGAYGTDLDALMVEEFIRSCIDDREPLVTSEDGAQAARVALAGYRSIVGGQPATV